MYESKRQVLREFILIYTQYILIDRTVNLLYHICLNGQLEKEYEKKAT